MPLGRDRPIDLRQTEHCDQVQTVPIETKIKCHATHTPACVAAERSKQVLSTINDRLSSHLTSRRAFYVSEPTSFLSLPETTTVQFRRMQTVICNLMSSGWVVVFTNYDTARL